MAYTDIHSEDRLVQATFATHLEQALGWESVIAWNQETFGPAGTLGRASEREVVLVRDLRAALIRLNPQLPSTAIEEAITRLTQHDYSRSLVQHNQNRDRETAGGGRGLSPYLAAEREPRISGDAAFAVSFRWHQRTLRLANTFAPSVRARSAPGSAASRAAYSQWPVTDAAVGRWSTDNQGSGRACGRRCASRQAATDAPVQFSGDGVGGSAVCAGQVCIDRSANGSKPRNTSSEQTQRDRLRSAGRISWLSGVG